MSSESIPVGLRSLLSKHYFLAQVKAGIIPNMSDSSFTDTTSWVGKWGGKFWRFWWYKEDRNTVMSDIENLITDTIDAINTHKDREAFLRLIINALASTRVGLHSMTTTYRDDPALIGRLQVQLTNIDLQLEKYRYLIKGYDEKDDNVPAVPSVDTTVGSEKDVPTNTNNNSSTNVPNNNNNNNNNNVTTNTNNVNTNNSATDEKKADKHKRRRTKLEPVSDDP